MHSNGSSSSAAMGHHKVMKVSRKPVPLNLSSIKKSPSLSSVLQRSLHTGTSSGGISSGRSGFSALKSSGSSDSPLKSGSQSDTAKQVGMIIESIEQIIKPQKDSDTGSPIEAFTQTPQSSSSTYSPAKAIIRQSGIFDEPYTPFVDPEIPLEIPKMSGYSTAHRHEPSFTPHMMLKPSSFNPPGNEADAKDILPSPEQTPERVLKDKVLPNSTAEKVLSLKTTCALCTDPNLMLYNSKQIDCGHHVHMCCLKNLNSKQYDIPPLCQLCDGYQPINKKSTVTHAGFDMNSNTDAFDVDPLRVDLYSQMVSSMEHLVALRIGCKLPVNKKYWSHLKSSEDVERIQKLSDMVLEFLDFSDIKLGAKRDICGKLRLVSSFVYDNSSSVVAYLFLNCIIITKKNAFGNEEFHSIVDINKESLDVFFSKENTLEFINRNSSNKSNFPIELQNERFTFSSNRKVLTTWLAALNNTSLEFDIFGVFDGNAKQSRSQELTQLEPPITRSYVESNNVEAVVCLERHMIKSVVKGILSHMGPQDKLGLIITEDGSYSYFRPHKVNWNGWKKMSKDFLARLDVYQDCQKPLAGVLTRMFSTPTPGKQQAAIFYTGPSFDTEFPSISSDVSLSSMVHTYCVKNSSKYDSMDTVLLNSDISNEMGRFCHITCDDEALAAISSIFSSEKYYRHHNIKVNIKLSDLCHFVGFEGQTPRCVKHQVDGGLQIDLGSVIAGQCKTIILRLEFKRGQLSEPHPSDIIKYCEVTSRSAATDSLLTAPGPYLRGTRWTPQMVFDKTCRQLVEQLHYCLYLDHKEIKNELKAAIFTLSSDIELFLDNWGDASAGSNDCDIDDSEDPMLSEKVTLIRLRHLEWGMSQFVAELSTLSENGLTGKLIDLIQTLDSQKSALCRNGIEQVFFEFLPTNVI